MEGFALRTGRSVIFGIDTARRTSVQKTPIFLVGSGAKEVGGTLWLWLCGVGLAVWDRGIVRGSGATYQFWLKVSLAQGRVGCVQSGTGGG